jgi:uncharacterized protein
LIEVIIDNLRVSLLSQQRIVMLKDMQAERYLAIFIGPYESEAITIELASEGERLRPLTHDLLRSVIETLGATVRYVLINDLRDDTFYARLMLETAGGIIEVDARPSDAIALAVRTKSPIFVDETLMERVGIVPEQDILALMDGQADEPLGDGEERGLGAFADFLSTLDLDDLDPS